MLDNIINKLYNGNPHMLYAFLEDSIGWGNKLSLYANIMSNVKDIKSYKNIIDSIGNFTIVDNTCKYQKNSIIHSFILYSDTDNIHIEISFMFYTKDKMNMSKYISINMVEPYDVILTKYKVKKDDKIDKEIKNKKDKEDKNNRLKSFENIYDLYLNSRYVSNVEPIQIDSDNDDTIDEVNNRIAEDFANINYDNNLTEIPEVYTDEGNTNNTENAENVDNAINERTTRSTRNNNPIGSIFNIDYDDYIRIINERQSYYNQRNRNDNNIQS